MLHLDWQFKGKIKTLLIYMNSVKLIYKDTCKTLIRSQRDLNPCAGSTPVRRISSPLHYHSAIAPSQLNIIPILHVCFKYKKTRIKDILVTSIAHQGVGPWMPVWKTGVLTAWPMSHVNVEYVASVSTTNNNIPDELKRCKDLLKKSWILLFIMVVI